MKKNFFSKLMPIMMMAVAVIGFTSCGSDSDSDNDEPELQPTWETSYEVWFELSDDVLNTADITAHIASPDGTFRDEKVTQPNLSWTLTGDKIPDKAGVLLTFVPKQNIDENEVYKIAISGGITVTSYKNNGMINHKGYSGSSNLSIKGDKLDQYYVGKGIGFAYGINENGAIVSVDIDEFDFGLNSFWEWIAGFLLDSDDK